MISGLGVDSVEVGRFRKVAKRWGKAFLKRLFTDRELDYCFSHANPYPSLAARFAAKEAVLKALDARALWKWRDMEVRRAESGRPSIVLTGAAAKHAKHQRAKSFLISITHDAGRATAVVLAVGGR
jgi:holo-[acyl-carrier protein] synthase